MKHVGMADLASASINTDNGHDAAEDVATEESAINEVNKSEAVDEVSDVSSNELSGPEDGECESDKEPEHEAFNNRPRKVLLETPSINNPSPKLAFNSPVVAHNPPALKVETPKSDNNTPVNKTEDTVE